MLPQPPPDAPAPPPSVYALRSQSKRAWIWAIGLPCLIGCFVMLTEPPSTHCGRRPDQTEAINNARQLGLALFEFESEFSSMPDFSTPKTVIKRTGTCLNLGSKSSNDFFRQLIAAEIASSENMFFARVAGTRKPDNVFTGTKALEKGECGFAYFPGASKFSDPKRPVAATPMIPGTDRFDPKPFEGRAVVLWSDASVTSISVRKDGCAFLGTSILMDPSNPVWGGKPPSIAWPDL